MAKIDTLFRICDPEEVEEIMTDFFTNVNHNFRFLQYQVVPFWSSEWKHDKIIISIVIEYDE